MIGAAPSGPDATRLQTLKLRREFLATARGLKASAPSLVLQGRRRGPDETDDRLLRVGYTCSKKVGNAPTRNRAKRRLRAAAAQVLPRSGRAGWDYVLIGRSEATNARIFADLLRDLEAALARVHGAAGAQVDGAASARARGAGGARL